MATNAHAGISHPFGGPHAGMSADSRRTYSQLFGYEVRPLNIKVREGSLEERMYGKDIPCRDSTLSIEELSEKYRDISPFAYNRYVLEDISAAKDSIDEASEATGVPEMAIAAALADENTARGARVAGVIDWAQDSIIAKTGFSSLDEVRRDYAKAVLLETLHGARRGNWDKDNTENDVGPANINMAIALDIFNENIVNAQGENHINKFLYKFVDKKASDTAKWEAFKKYMLLDMNGSAHLAAANIQKGAIKLAPYMSNSTREEQVAILVTYFKQGDNYLQKYLQSPHRGKRDIRAGEGAKIFRNWDALKSALGY